MVMMKLSFLKYRTNLILRRNKTPRTTVAYKAAKTAGIIFTVEDKQKHFAVKEFIKRLESDGKHIQVLEFLPERKENYEFKFDFFMEKDITFWGNVQSASAVQFADAPLDYLFYLDLEPNPLILHLLARSHAKCRAGILWDGGEKYLDFMVTSVANTPALLDTLYKYITQIR
jgi:hypothetical protein